MGNLEQSLRPHVFISTAAYHDTRTRGCTRAHERVSLCFSRALAANKILCPLVRLALSLLKPHGGRLIFTFTSFPQNADRHIGGEQDGDVGSAVGDILCRSWMARLEASLDSDGLASAFRSHMRVVDVCRQEWKKSTGHVLARDCVVLERQSEAASATTIPMDLISKGVQPTCENCGSGSGREAEDFKDRGRAAGRAP